MMFAGVLLLGTYATPLVMAHALRASSVRVSVFIDDGHREPAAPYFLSVKLWGICLRIEWIGANADKPGNRCT